jgi:hypothetical protein
LICECQRDAGCHHGNGEGYGADFQNGIAIAAFQLVALKGERQMMEIFFSSCGRDVWNYFHPRLTAGRAAKANQRQEQPDGLTHVLPGDESNK